MYYAVKDSEDITLTELDLFCYHKEKCGGREMRIFLSSTYVGLKEIRKVAITYLVGIMGHVTDITGTVVAMEFFNATERFCKEECLDI